MMDDQAAPRFTAHRFIRSGVGFLLTWRLDRTDLAAQSLRLSKRSSRNAAKPGKHSR